MLVIVGLILLVAYAIVCTYWPHLPCRRYGGDGKTQITFRLRASVPICPRHEGKGRRVRLGRKLYEISRDLYPVNGAAIRLRASAQPDGSRWCVPSSPGPSGSPAASRHVRRRGIPRPGTTLLPERSTKSQDGTTMVCAIRHKCEYVCRRKVLDWTH
jgi:hypothetical protein